MLILEYLLYSRHNAMGLICIISSFNLHYQASKIIIPILQMRPSLGLREVSNLSKVILLSKSMSAVAETVSNPGLIQSSSLKQKTRKSSFSLTHPLYGQNWVFLSPSRGLSHPRHISSHFMKMMKLDKVGIAHHLLMHQRASMLFQCQSITSGQEILRN